GTYEARGEKIAKNLLKAKDILDRFEKSSLIQVLRADNTVADQLARLASSMATIRNRRITILSSDRAVVEQQMEIMYMGPTPPSWKEDIMRFLTQGTTPDNPKETRALRVKATRFVLLDEELYKRGFSQPLLKYLTPEEGNYVLREIHEEICGNHLRGRALAGKVVKQVEPNFQEKKSKNGAKGWRSNSSSPQSASRKQTIKPRSPTEQSPTLEDEVRSAKVDWVDEFPNVLWAYEQRQEPPLGISFYPLLGDRSRCTGRNRRTQLACEVL
ncbi:UNVERIFIED_CONTAM: hypothetical protein Sangu_3195900, partial [Sesamum angustifolium]